MNGSILNWKEELSEGPTGNGYGSRVTHNAIDLDEKVEGIVTKLADNIKANTLEDRIKIQMHLR